MQSLLSINDQCKMIATIDEYKKIKILDANNSKDSPKEVKEENRVNKIIFDKKGDKILAAMNDGSISKYTAILLSKEQSAKIFHNSTYRNKQNLIIAIFSQVCIS